MTEGRIVVAGVSAVYGCQRGRGIPLVLVHGCGGDHRAFDALAASLPGRAVVAICLPGRSGIPGPAPATAAASALWVASVLSALRVDRAIAGGHSYGGAVAIELAFLAADRAPALVAGLVLLDTGAKLRAHADILQGAEAAARADPTMEANLTDWRACDAFDRLHDVARLRVPTLAVTGRDDLLTPPRYAAWLGDHIPGAAVVLVDGAGHYGPVTHPREYADAIAAFLDRFATVPAGAG